MELNFKTIAGKWKGNNTHMALDERRFSELHKVQMDF